MKRRAAAPRKTRRVPPLHYPNLATYLAESGDTQQHIAAAVGSTQAHVSRIAAGEIVPRPVLAARLAEYAHVPLDSFTRVYLAKKAPASRASSAV